MCFTKCTNCTVAEISSHGQKLQFVTCNLRERENSIHDSFHVRNLAILKLEYLNPFVISHGSPLFDFWKIHMAQTGTWSQRPSLRLGDAGCVTLSVNSALTLKLNIILFSHSLHGGINAYHNTGSCCSMWESILRTKKYFQFFISKTKDWKTLALRDCSFPNFAKGWQEEPEANARCSDAGWGRCQGYHAAMHPAKSSHDSVALFDFYLHTELAMFQGKPSTISPRTNSSFKIPQRSVIHFISHMYLVVLIEADCLLIIGEISFAWTRHWWNLITTTYLVSGVLASLLKFA